MVCPKSQRFEMVKQRVIQYYENGKYIYSVSGKQDKFSKKNNMDNAPTAISLKNSK